MVEPARPPKKPRRGVEHDLLSIVNPGPSNRKEVKSQIHTHLDPSMGDSGATMVMDYTKFLNDACSTLTPDVLDRFKSDQATGGLVNFGLMSTLFASSLILQPFLHHSLSASC